MPYRAGMRTHVVILGAGFGGMELATRLSETLVDDVHVTLIDRSDSFVFGFSKFEIMLGRQNVEEVRLPYSDYLKPEVEFRREVVTKIDPLERVVETDGGTYQADILVVGLGAEYDNEATPGFADDGYEFYSVPGAERLSDLLPDFTAGSVVIAILGPTFKCPPAPFEGAFLLHDFFSARGVRSAIDMTVINPLGPPVPVAKHVSEPILAAMAERDIEFIQDDAVTRLDTEAKTVDLASGRRVPYDLFLGVPVHRVPDVVEASGLAVDGWIPVDQKNLTTRFPNVYAIGDVTSAPVPKAGVMAENAAQVVADDIVSRIRGGDGAAPFEGAGPCYIEFGAGVVAKVDINFLGGPSPSAVFHQPTTALAAEKEAFAAERRRRWFGR